MSRLRLLSVLACTVSLASLSNAATLESLWEFDGDFTSANDISYDGTSHGTVDLVPGVLGDAACFEGGEAAIADSESVDHVDSKLMVPAYFNDGLSIMGWLKPGVQASGPILSLDESHGTVLTNAFSFFVESDGSLTLELRDQLTFLFGSSPGGVVPQDVWSHVTVTWDGSLSGGIAMFVNGREVAVTVSQVVGPFGGFVAGVPVNLRIGAGYKRFANVMMGYAGGIDHLSLWKGALTEGEIFVDYQGTVEPVTAIEELVLVVIDLNLQVGIENSLDAKLDSALAALNDANASNDVAAINSLEAFKNAVEAQSGNKISPEDALVLINAANAIIANLEQT